MLAAVFSVKEAGIVVFCGTEGIHLLYLEIESEVLWKIIITDA